jgi:hypothetical protein
MMEHGGENGLIPLINEHTDGLLSYQMVSTGNPISAGRAVELFKLAQAGKSHEVVEVLR